MNALSLAALRNAVAGGKLVWRKHVLQRLAERDIAQAAVLAVLQDGEKIRDYPEDRPFPSALFMGHVASGPLHVVVALDEAAGTAYIITVYEPTKDVFEPDFRTRRKP